MPKVTGKLTDFGFDVLAGHSPRLLFRHNTPGVAGTSIMPTRPVASVPEYNGYFEVDLTASARIAPAGYYTVTLQWTDLPGRTVYSEEFPGRLYVPAEGGALADILRVPANPGLVWEGTEPPGNPSPGSWWLGDDGLLQEYDGTGWNFKQNIRGPAGYNATGAAEDDAAIAALMMQESGKTKTGAALDVLGYRVHGLTGKGDESAKIQAALNAVAFIAGATVALPAGTFFAQNLKMQKGTRLIGQGRGATTLRAVAAGDNGYLLRTAGGCTVTDLKLQAGSFDTILVDAFESARLTLNNLYLEGNANIMLGTGIRFAGTGTATSSHGNQASNIIAMNLAVGIWAQSWCYDNEFNQVWIGPCGTGMQLASGSHMINGLHIWGCTNNGLSLYTEDGGYSRIVNAYLETNGGYGLFVNNREGNSFVGVRLWKNGLGGALVRGGQNSQFSGCWADDNNGAGLTFQNHLYATVSNFHAYDNQPTKTQTYAVRSTGTSDYLTLTGSMIAREHHKVGSHELVGSHNKVFGNTTELNSSTFDVGSATHAAPSGFTARSAPGFAKMISLFSGTTARWFFGADATAESGDDAGSDFVITGRNDTGGPINTPVHIRRADGRVSLAAPLRLARLTPATRPPAAAAGSGAVYYDTTLSKPLYSDGGNWRDAAGVLS